MGSVTATATAASAVAPTAGLLTDIVVAALVAGAVSLVTTLSESGRARRDRLREQYADAFRAYAAYREFPYVIRRRGDDNAAERIRISEQLRGVQERLTFSRAWMDLESSDVAREYRKLVDGMRDVAGNAMRRAWELPPVGADNDMNIPDYANQLNALIPLERAYIDAAARGLTWWRIFLQRG